MQVFVFVPVCCQQFHQKISEYISYQALCERLKCQVLPLCNLLHFQIKTLIIEYQNCLSTPIRNPFVSTGPFASSLHNNWWISGRFRKKNRADHDFSETFEPKSKGHSCLQPLLGPTPPLILQGLIKMFMR